MMNNYKHLVEFKIGDILEPDHSNHFFSSLVVYIGGTRSIMDYTGYTLPHIDAIRWNTYKKVKGIRVKKLKFNPDQL